MWALLPPGFLSVSELAGLGSQSLDQMCLFTGIEDGATAVSGDKGCKKRAIISCMSSTIMSFVVLEGGVNPQNMGYIIRNSLVFNIQCPSSQVTT